MYQPDEYIQKALLTWYPKDHDLHFEPLHPVIKLAGEAGEILDLYGKNEFKPGFDWWECKHCGLSEDKHVDEIWCDWIEEHSVYTPKVLDELGDWWYYCRILMYLSELNVEDIQDQIFDDSLLDCLNGMNYYSARLLNYYIETDNIDAEYLEGAYYSFLSVLDHLDVTLNELTEMNYIKLNSDETNHGWKGA